jgi:N-succinyldiaminopimelate aminotransferase
MPRGTARRLEPFGTSVFGEMTRLALQHSAVNLSQGFPDFDGPDFAKEAAIAAIRAGHGQYARTTGIPDLNRALSEKLKRFWGLEYAPDTEITVTSGATEAIFSTIQGLCEPGDEVILFEPYYDSYKASVVMAGAVPRIVTLRSPDWSFDPTELAAAAASPRARAILLNTPHNPTGKVFSPEEMDLLARICRERDLVCITDEVYEHLVYDGVHVPMASLPGMRERTVTISSFGKTFSLTGWKIGWAAAPAALTAGVRAAHQFVTFATATPLQHAAAVTIANAPESYYAELAASYRQRRDYLTRELAAIGFDVRPSAGTYFLCAGFRRFSTEDDIAFAKSLVTGVGVAVVPPSSFYDHAELGRDWVRFAFCKKTETLEAAVARLKTLAPRAVSAGAAPA